MEIKKWRRDSGCRRMKELLVKRERKDIGVTARVC